MPNFNRTILIGHLGRDPIIRYTPSGTAVADFPMAVTEKWKDQAGNKKEQTSWFDVVVFGKSAEFSGQYLAKGQAVLIEGKLRQETWEPEEGQKRSKIKVIAQNITTLGSKGKKEEVDDETPF